VRYAFAGGAAATATGAHHNGMIFAVIPKNEHESYGSPEALLEANPMPMTGTKRRVTLDQLLASTSVAILTIEHGLFFISRRTVLQYISNRKGGVHFDPNRDLAVQNLRKRRKEIAYHLLDHSFLRVGHLYGPEYEVAAMAHAVAAADWSAQIVRVAQEAAPADFNGDPDELKFWTGQREADGTGWATSKFTSPPEAATEK
jgi:hypothetical protein